MNSTACTYFSHSYTLFLLLYFSTQRFNNIPACYFFLIGGVRYCNTNGQDQAAVVGCSTVGLVLENPNVELPSYEGVGVCPNVEFPLYEGVGVCPNVEFPLYEGVGICTNIKFPVYEGVGVCPNVEFPVYEGVGVSTSSTANSAFYQYVPSKVRTALCLKYIRTYAVYYDRVLNLFRGCAKLVWSKGIVPWIKLMQNWRVWLAIDLCYVNVLLNANRYSHSHSYPTAYSTNPFMLSQIMKGSHIQSQQLKWEKFMTN